MDKASFEGFYYLNRLDPDILVEGVVVRCVKAPPYLVVHRKPQSIIVTKFGGEVWRARVSKIGDMSNLHKPTFWRATEIELLEQLPFGVLFGDNGDRITELISQIQDLTVEQVQKITPASTPEQLAAYTRAWKNWDSAQGNTKVGNIDIDYLILAVYGKGSESPIHHGFSMIHKCVDQQARRLEGEEAFEEYYDEHDCEMRVGLNEKWRYINRVFLFAAMAVGAPAYLQPNEITILAAPLIELTNLVSQQKPTPTPPPT